jgi:probable HAF family extracellular repeat protein
MKDQRVSNGDRPAQIRSIVLYSVLAAILSVPAFCDTPPYLVFDLGTLGGSATFANAINDAGQVAGSSFIEDDAGVRPFLWSNGLMTDLGTLGGSGGEAYGINGFGQVVGAAQIPGDTAFHAFLFSGGIMRDLGSLPGFSQSAALGINNSGQVVGYSYNPEASSFRAFFYSGGVMTDLGTLGGSNSFAQAINTSGDIVGSSDVNGDVARHAFLYRGGIMHDLGTLGGTGSGAAAINDLGQVAGVAGLAGDQIHHAFLFSFDQMHDLGVLPGAEHSSALGINNAGEVVGLSLFPGVDGRASHYKDGVVLDVNDLIVPGGLAQGTFLFDAVGINSSGQIIANGLNDFHGYLLSSSAPPTISPTPAITLKRGTGGTLQIATVSDPHDLPVDLTVSVQNATPLNNVSLTGISVSGAGVVLANVTAACEASSASFTLRVTNTLGQFSQAVLDVAVVDACVTPPPSCSYSIGPGSAINVPGGLSGGSINVITSPGCAWSATSDVPWLTITSGTLGSGPDTINFVAATDTGPQRNGTILVAGRSYLVTQAAIGDNVTPANALMLTQFVGGGTEWTTSLLLTNLSGIAESFTLHFFDDIGSPKSMPIEGFGLVEGISGTIPAGGTQRYVTGAFPSIQSAWVRLTPGAAGTSGLTGLAIFRQTLPSGGSTRSSEAVVDLVGGTDTKSVMLFDNADGFDTAIALVNPDAANSLTVQGEARNDQGEVIGSGFLTLPPLGHTAFMLSEGFPATANARGSIRLSAPKGFGGLGLRFSPFQTFTSFRLLTSPAIP